MRPVILPLLSHFSDRAPARSETVEDLKLAALSFGKDVAKLSCCAG